MVTQPLEASVRQAGRAAVITLRGEIDSFGEESLNRAYEQAEGLGQPEVLLNFSAVEYVNSAGIALIVGLLAKGRKSGRRLLVTGLSNHYVELFQITRLSDYVLLFPDEATALAHAAA